MLVQDNRYYGMYRAKVVDNVDPDKQGKVKIWIPSLMPKIPDTEGIWAYPANNPLGGRDPDNQDTWGQGTCLIPVKGAWVWIFFEGGNPSKPFYFAALDIEQSKVLAENQVGGQYWNKFTLLRTKTGRIIIISDDPDDERIEFTGKKRQQQAVLEGDTSSVYNLQGNQTTILIDERQGKEKVLIVDHKGNGICINTEQEQLHIKVTDNTLLKCKTLHITADQDIVMQCKNLSIKCDNVNCKASSNVRITSGGSTHIKCGGLFAADGSHVSIQDGASESASPSSPESPTLERG